MKRCTRCATEKPLDEFYDSNARKSGKRPECIPCSKSAVNEWRGTNREQVAAYQREWTRANPDKVRGYDLKRRYGLTPEGYETLLTAQGGMCAIEGCGTMHAPSANLHVDHDHSCCPGMQTCGRCIRGLLCGPCNLALGLMQESLARLSGMANYVTKHKGD